MSPNACVFAGQEARFAYLGPAGTVEWSLVAAHRTLAQGSSEAPAAGPNEVSQLVVRIPVPRLHAGVVLPAELRLAWHEAGKERQFLQSVTIFSPDALSIRQAALEQAQIGLFDPVGDTAETFERHDVPHSRLLNLAAIDLVDEGVVVVGEGISFREHPNLPDALTRAAERGVAVLCLAPTDGEFAFPQPDEAALRPRRVALEQSDVVRRFDKRFDLLPPVSRLALESRRSTVVVRVSEDGAGWSWLSVQYPPQTPAKPPVELIVCGLGIIRNWEESPVPRYLLVALLEELAAHQSAEEKEANDLSQR